MKNPKTWLVTFDSVVCKIYDYTKPIQDHIPLIYEVYEPENKLRDIDLTSDRSGRYQFKGYAMGTYSQESDPKKRNQEKFAAEINKILQQGYNSHQFEKLIIVAAPHMMGLLSKKMDKKVKKCIEHKVEKNAVQLTNRELPGYVREAIWQ